MMNYTQPNTSWYIPLNNPLKKPTQKSEPFSFEIEFPWDTDATIWILNTQTWNAMKAYPSPSEYELKQDVDTKVRTASSQILPIEGIFKLTFLPFRDNHATLTITFAKAHTKNNILGLPFLNTCCKTIDTENSCFILKYNMHNRIPLKQIPFLQISHEQTQFYSEVFNLPVVNHLNIPGRHILVIKIPLKEITGYPI